MEKYEFWTCINFTYRGGKAMNARLREFIDVSTIETMAEQFYKLTNISHQLLDAERVCIFSFGINEMKICKLPKIEIPIFLYNQYLGSFVVWCPKVKCSIVKNTLKC